MYTKNTKILSQSVCRVVDDIRCTGRRLFRQETLSKRPAAHNIYILVLHCSNTSRLQYCITIIYHSRRERSDNNNGFRRRRLTMSVVVQQEDDIA